MEGKMIRSHSNRRLARVALILALTGSALPAAAQDAANNEARLRKVEAEVRALQRQVFPGPDGKYFAPQVETTQPAAPVAGSPATTPVTDLLARVDAVETALARLTAQTEENANKLSLLEARLNVIAPPPAAATPAPAPAAAPTVTPPATDTASANLAAMTGGASAPAKPAPAPAATPPALAPKPAAQPPAATKPAAATPSPQRLAAVKAVEKPRTADAGDDEYSYGFRLWEAKFYPEAQQQLKMYLEKYPRHARASYARNLLGRTYLDDGKPREAAQWFLQNYQADKKADRAPDSLLYLAESMRLLKDTTRACIALAEFGETYPREAAGRLKAQYDVTRATVKCN